MSLLNPLKNLIEYQQQNYWRCNNCFCLVLLQEKLCLSCNSSCNLESALPRHDKFASGWPRDAGKCHDTKSTPGSIQEVCPEYQHRPNSCNQNWMVSARVQQVEVALARPRIIAAATIPLLAAAANGNNLKRVPKRRGALLEMYRPTKSGKASTHHHSSPQISTENSSTCGLASDGSTGFHLFLLGTRFDRTSCVYMFGGHGTILAVIRDFATPPPLRILFANQLVENWRCETCMSHNKHHLEFCSSCEMPRERDVVRN